VLERKDRPKAVSVALLLAERDIFPQLECAQAIFFRDLFTRFSDRCRGPDERERCIRVLLPDDKILRRNPKPAKFEHVSAWFGHQSDLCPGDFIDSQSFAFHVHFRRLMIGLRKIGDVIAGILERDKLASAGQRDRIVKGAGPAFVRHRLPPIANRAARPRRAAFSLEVF
jgi:hypothetical protein